jgi:hypothetical protein
MCLAHVDFVKAVQDGWQKLDQATINEWVDQIPKILQQSLDLDGKLSGNLIELGLQMTLFLLSPTLPDKRRIRMRGKWQLPP